MAKQQVLTGCGNENKDQGELALKRRGHTHPHLDGSDRPHKWALIVSGKGKTRGASLPDG